MLGWRNRSGVVLPLSVLLALRILPRLMPINILEVSRTRWTSECRELVQGLLPFLECFSATGVQWKLFFSMHPLSLWKNGMGFSTDLEMNRLRVVSLTFKPCTSLRYVGMLPPLALLPWRGLTGFPLQWRSIPIIVHLPLQRCTSLGLISTKPFLSF